MNSSQSQLARTSYMVQRNYKGAEKNSFPCAQETTMVNMIVATTSSMQFLISVSSVIFFLGIPLLQSMNLQ